MKMQAAISSGPQGPVQRKSTLFLLIFTLLSGSKLLGQVPIDREYDPPVPKPAYVPGTGPLVAIDEAHHNSHTAGEGFAPFAKLLRKDGYRVEAFTNTFTAAALQKLDVLVIVNALAKQNWTNESRPTLPAFEKSEMDALEQWVKNGGALLLVAGHMPWPRAVESLAERFDVFTAVSAFRETPSRASRSYRGVGIWVRPAARCWIILFLQVVRRMKKSHP
jgi:hypothetical protein